MRLPPPAAAGLAVAVALLVLLTAPAAVPARTGDEPFAEGRLWRVVRDGQPPSHVFGTFHIPDSRVVPLRASVTEALVRAEALLLELNPDDRDGMASFTFLPPGVSITDWIDGASTGRLLALGRDAGIPETYARRLRPIVLATLLSLPGEVRRRQQDGLGGVDVALADVARANGVPMIGLETAIEQGEAMVAVEHGHEAAILDGILTQHPHRRERYDALVDAYVAGEVLRYLNESLAQLSDEDADLARTFLDVMIVQRNGRMVTRMGPYLDRGNMMVAVGAAHLPGSDGILNLLARRGYRVERVE
jgi:hypothetical protein